MKPIFTRRAQIKSTVPDTRDRTMMEINTAPHSQLSSHLLVALGVVCGDQVNNREYIPQKC